MKIPISSAILLLAGWVAVIAPPHASAQDDLPVPLDSAVRKFNEWAAKNPVGKSQRPLTEDAVIAAIRWYLLDREKLNVSEKTARILETIPETRVLPKDFNLEFEEGFEPNDHVVFEVWMVKLRLPGGTYEADGGSTAIRISHQMLRSRLIGEEERKVMQAWAQKERDRGGSVGSFERVEYMRRYRAEREAAAERDRGKTR